MRQNCTFASMGISKDQLEKIRTDYKQKELNEDSCLEDGIEQFHQWFSDALQAEITEVNAMVLSTTHIDFKPANRIVLLKGIEENAFVFFTNYNSRKGKELLWNPYGSLLFFWKELERQIRIEGRVEKISAEASDEYFNTRPRASQIGAWVSEQSEIIENRNVLNEKLKQIENKFENQTVSRPPHWGGYKLMPAQIEFWQGRPSRLHDRILYTRVNGTEWKKERLSP